MLYAATAIHWPGRTGKPPSSMGREAMRMMVGAGGNSRRLSFRHASRYGRLHVRSHAKLQESRVQQRRQRQDIGTCRLGWK